MNFVRRFPFHTLLFTIFPLLALYVENDHEVSASVLIRPLLVSLVLGMVFFLLALLFTRKLEQAGLLASFLFLLFSSYGHVYNYLAERGIFLGRNRFLIPIFLVLLAVFLIWLFKNRGKLTRLTFIFNWMALVLIGFSLFQIGLHAIRRVSAVVQLAPARQDQSGQGMKQPDIYYIVLDTYSRSDVLKDVMGYDNAWFTDELRQAGFYIAECSNANYPSTNVSIASTLNMQYLQDIASHLPVGATMDAWLPELLKHSLVRQQLEQAGYHTIAFATGYDWLEWKDASEYVTPAKYNSLLGHLNPFEALWLQSTAFAILSDVQSVLLNNFTGEMKNPTSEHVERQLLLLDTLQDAGSLPGPKFVYAHVMIPHGPLVFRADGSLNENPPDLDKGIQTNGWMEYLAQVEFINHRILVIVENILSESETPPIIIIQADHGVKDHRFPILNAYYFPDEEAKEKLYPSISPVNTFRLIFNAYFGSSYEMLADEQYTPVDKSLEIYQATEEELPDCSPVIY